MKKNLCTFGLLVFLGGFCCVMTPGCREANWVRMDSVGDSNQAVLLPEPLKHRETANSCVNVHSPVEPGDNRDDYYSNCSKHSDCTDGVNGKCISGIGMAWSLYFCTYDECATDDDCAEGAVCHCSATEAARCVVVGNCQVDEDCGQGGYCSPSTDNNCGGHMTTTGYHCHTAKDTCTDNDDCADDEYCNYSTYDNRWNCEPLDNGCAIG